MTRTIRVARCAAAFTLACAALVGCGSEKKADDNPAAPAEPKGKNPDPPPPGGPPEPPAPPGQPKYKLNSADFIKEYANNPRAANGKYDGALVELSGNVTRSAGVELDGFGKPVGGPGDYKASFSFGAWNAGRAQTVVVRGLKSSAVGSVLRGQQAKVKGRVARYVAPNPIELTDAELLSTGPDTSIAVGLPGMKWDFELTEKLEEFSAKLTAMVTGRGKTDAEYLEVKTEDGATRRCYLMEGIGVLFPSGFPDGLKLTLTGTYRSEVINRDDPDAQPMPVFRDCVPLQRDPKAK